MKYSLTHNSMIVIPNIVVCDLAIQTEVCHLIVTYELVIIII